MACCHNLLLRLMVRGRAVRDSYYHIFSTIRLHVADGVSILSWPHRHPMFLACLRAQGWWWVRGGGSSALIEGRVTHICVGNPAIIGSDNGLSPYRRQPIIWTNDGILLIRTLKTGLSEISVEVLKFAFKKIPLMCRLWNGGHFVSASMC